MTTHETADHSEPSSPHPLTSALCAGLRSNEPTIAINMIDYVPGEEQVGLDGWWHVDDVERILRDLTSAQASPPADDLRAVLEHIAITACESGDAVWANEAREIAEAMLTDPRIDVRPYGTVTDTEVERSCEIMHDAYEAAAASEGWETQEASRKPWVDVPEANKRTMRYAVRTLLEARS